MLLCVYNAKHALYKAIDSILNQTFSDYELIVIDDGSTDGSSEILQTYADRDSRIRLVRQENAGLTAALNAGLRIAKGEYIARQDADDISIATRLEEQLAFMKAHPEVVLTGTDYEIIDDDDESLVVIRNSRRKRLKQRLENSNQFVHGTIMFRSNIGGDAVRYNEFYKKAQDYDLILRLSEQGDVAVVPNVLYKWRFSRYGILASNVTVYGDRAIINHRRRISRQEEDYSKPDAKSIVANPSRWSFEYALAERYLSGYQLIKARQSYKKALAEPDMPKHARLVSRRKYMITCLPVWLLRFVREM